MKQWSFLLGLAVIAIILQGCTATHICTSLQQNNLRLYNPYGNASVSGGMLQRCYSGIWRAVCDYTFDCTTEGRAACKQLGYGGANLRVAVMSNSALQYGPWSYYYYSYYYCTTTSSSLTSCRQYSGYSSCDSNDHAGLWCITIPPSVSQCTNGSVRLVGGETAREGRLEYCYHGVWSQFCNTFHLEEATVACKQLGFTNSPGAIIFTDGRFGLVSNFSLFSYFSCSSSASEANLTSCALSHTCATRCSIFYGISCYEPNSDNCTEGSVRLVNSTSENEGRIEACRNGNWGPVCGVGVVEAYVVCRALGFDAAPRQSYTNSKYYGDSSRVFSYGITKCWGWEKSITECTRQSHLSCSRSQAASVICRDGCTNGAIRLTGGSHTAEGTIEVCYYQTWRVVASSHWTQEDSQVVCRQLGFTSEGAISHVSSPFGKPRRSVLYSGVLCVGNEAKLMDCPANMVSYEAGKSLLSHVNVAGVSCTQPLTTSRTSTTVYSSSVLPQLPCTTAECVCPTPTVLSAPPTTSECPLLTTTSRVTQYITSSIECACPTPTLLSAPPTTSECLPLTTTSKVTQYVTSSCPVPLIPTPTITSECSTTTCSSVVCPSPPPPPPACPSVDCPSITCPTQQPVTTQILTTCPTTSMPQPTRECIPPQALPPPTLPPPALPPPALPPPKEQSVTTVVTKTISTVAPDLTSSVISTSSYPVSSPPITEFPTIDAAAVKEQEESCVPYFNTLIALCVLFAVTTSILGASICYMMYKIGRMRGRIKQHNLTVSLASSTNPLYTPSENVYDEASKDNKDRPTSADQ